jgi:hypothetical protein
MDKKDIEKVYCKECKHCRHLGCNHSEHIIVGDTPYSQVVITGNIDKLNANNDCKAFEKKK